MGKQRSNRYYIDNAIFKGTGERRDTHTHAHVHTWVLNPPTLKPKRMNYKINKYFML